MILQDKTPARSSALAELDKMTIDADNYIVKLCHDIYQLFVCFPIETLTAQLMSDVAEVDSPIHPMALIGQMRNLCLGHNPANAQLVSVLNSEALAREIMEVLGNQAFSSDINGTNDLG